MICPKCGGIGRIDNPRYYKQSPIDSYLDGIPSMIECKKCNGKGHIFGNVSDAINLLNDAVTDNRGLTAKETKQLLNILNEYPNGTK